MSALLDEHIERISEDDEYWSPVKDFESRFFVSSLGRIVSHDHRKNTVALLRPCIDSTGYFATDLRSKPLHRRVRVHVLVAEHFLTTPRFDVRRTVNHKNGDRLDNRAVNLEWITARANCAHARATGLLDNRGSRHVLAKLTERDVLTIRALRGLLSSKEIAGLYKLNDRYVRDVIAGRTWRHI